MARDTTLNVKVDKKTPGQFGKPQKRVSIPLGITLEGREIMMGSLNQNTDKREMEVANRIRRHLRAVFAEYKKLRKKGTSK